MPIRNETNDLIAFLNTLVELDPDAISDLLSNRVFCNEKLAEHPTVQVSDCTSDNVVGQYQVGILGILNGFCGIIERGPKAGYGPITARYDEDGMLVGFERTNSASP